MYRTHQALKTSHKSTLPVLRILALGLFVFLLSACIPSKTPTQLAYAITIDADGKQTPLSVPAGTTVQLAVEKAGLTINPLDRLEPAGFTVLTSGDTIRIVRVREVFENKENTIPFDRQTVKNESLPEGQTMLIQAGVNGVEQVTFRQIYENDQEISRSIFKSVMMVEPHPEIVMVGVQKPFTAIPIPGKLAYLAGGNAWMMEKDTGERRPLVTTADLDGRVFSLSPDAGWLLFTRQSTKEPGEEINTLWMVSLDESAAKPISLRVSNIIHFAGWIPGKGLSVAYSTVEPRATAPGWQANNDLFITTYSATGVILETQQVIEANTGGVYGWWGTTYAVSPDGAKLAYGRPDGVGLVDLEKKTLVPLVDITPYQTRADWAWVTGLAWAPNHRVLYMVSHPPKPGLSDQESSPLFDLMAVVLDEGANITLSPQSGMFGYPSASPQMPDNSFHLAYLQAIFPEQSDSGRYRIVVMDRDGSNRQVIFPPEGLPGLEPQQVIWSRLPFAKGGNWIAAVYQGNLWLINPDTQEIQQVTGDGLIKRIDW
jgi:hypothetical protein